MTREELKELAKKYVYCLDEEYKKSHNLSDKQIEEIFFAGAEITQINLIDKACEWLRVELDKEEERHYIHVHGFDKERRDIFIEQFRKAMKGE